MDRMSIDRMGEPSAVGFDRLPLGFSVDRCYVCLTELNFGIEALNRVRYERRADGAIIGVGTTCPTCGVESPLGGHPSPDA
jgi:hypothetical protein